MFANTTGTGNTATGASTLYSNTTGIYNTATGSKALYNNSTGSANTANGETSLNNNTIGSNNTASGQQSLFYNTSGYSNTANGSASLHENTTGWFNTAMGENALFSNISGTGNTADGYQALNNSTGNYNTAIGYRALNSNTSGSSNTAIGFQANVSSGGLIEASAIGSNANVDCSQCMVLGTSNIKVGIGQTNPLYPLNFSQTTGEKVSFLNNGSSSIGFATASSLLKIHTDVNTSDIAFGFGNNFSFIETMRLKGNGNLEVQQLKVGNGTLISKQQAGNAVVGSNGSNFKTFTVTFPTPFSGIPNVTATPKNDPAYGPISDTFCVTVRAVTTTSVTFNILRVDANAAWLQNLLLAWQAWE
jgi:hypothetical protein